MIHGMEVLVITMMEEAILRTAVIQRTINEALMKISTWAISVEIPLPTKVYDKLDLQVWFRNLICVVLNLHLWPFAIKVTEIVIFFLFFRRHRILSSVIAKMI